MLATHMVQNSDYETIGFILDDGSLYMDYFIKNNIDFVDNLRIGKNKELICKTKLPILTYESIIQKKYETLVADNPFQRDIQEHFLAWKNNTNHHVLQLGGARQIGKTTELLKFAYKNYEYIIYVDVSNDIYQFEETVINANACTLTMEGYCRKANLPHFVNSNKTILILDEIQAKKRVYNSIRTLHGNLACDIIVAGSYLQHTSTSKGFFLPAGTISYANMHSLSFREFCQVFQADNLLDEMDLFENHTQKEQEVLYSLFDVYTQIGGYPEVVKAYMTTKDTTACDTILKDMLSSFANDSFSYRQKTNEPLIFDIFYEQIIKEQLARKHVEFLKLIEIIADKEQTSAAVSFDTKEVDKAMSWLLRSGILGNCIFHMEEEIGFGLNYFLQRLYFKDCGIASYIGKTAGIPKNDLDTLLSETFVYTELNHLCNQRYMVRKVTGTEPYFSVCDKDNLDFIALGKNHIAYTMKLKADTKDTKTLTIYKDRTLVEKNDLDPETKEDKEESLIVIPIFAVGARFPYGDKELVNDFGFSLPPLL